jgi:hypothetical protein
MRICLFLLLVAATSVQADWKTDMLEEGETLYKHAKESTASLYQELAPLVHDGHRSQEAHRNALWNTLLPQLEQGLVYTDKLEKAPESAWIGSDKKDLRQDINQLFDNIIDTLIDDDFLAYKKEINTLQQEITNNKHTISSYREKRVSAPMQSHIKTTKADYSRKIEALQEENREYALRTEQIKGKLIEQFSRIGVNLTSEQINVLLTRVDGDNIIQMALMMDLLKHITEQIIVLMKENREDFAYARKYYGLHLVSLELVVYIQQRYIDKVTHLYLPKIESIISEAQNMATQTQRLADAEVSQRRRDIYKKNIETQRLTARVAQRYKQDLIASKRSMVHAQNIARKNMQLARNTYKTVVLSADLYALISENQNLFSEISRIQVPNIIPFENMQIEKKYNELTKLIQKRE